MINIDCTHAVINSLIDQSSAHQTIEKAINMELAQVSYVNNIIWQMGNELVDRKNI